jgi:hypothetical protein
MNEIQWNPLLLWFSHKNETFFLLSIFRRTHLSYTLKRVSIFCLFEEVCRVIIKNETCTGRKEKVNSTSYKLTSIFWYDNLLSTPFIIHIGIVYSSFQPSINISLNESKDLWILGIKSQRVSQHYRIHFPLSININVMCIISINFYDERVTM